MNQQKILWGALVFSAFIYLFIAYTLAPVAARPFEESMRDPLTLAMYGAAFATFVAGLVIPSLLVKSPPRLKMIVAMALFEACTIFGLVTAFIHHDWHLLLPPWIAALIGFVREWPREDVSSRPA